MANVGSQSLRRATRLCAKNVTSSGLIRATVPRAVAGVSQKLGHRYISETKTDAATVNVESAIKADQKKFFQETGKKVGEQPMMGSTANADAMMDPMAGE